MKSPKVSSGYQPKNKFLTGSPSVGENFQKDYGVGQGGSSFYQEAKKRSLKGSSEFTAKEQKQGFKVHTTSSGLLKMDVDGYDMQKDFLLAKRREGSIGKDRRVYRRSEGKE